MGAFAFIPYLLFFIVDDDRCLRGRAKALLCRCQPAMSFPVALCDLNTIKLMTCPPPRARAPSLIEMSKMMDLVLEWQGDYSEVHELSAKSELGA